MPPFFSKKFCTSLLWKNITMKDMQLHVEYLSTYICADSCGLWSVTACGYFCDFIYVDN